MPFIRWVSVEACFDGLCSVEELLVRLGMMEFVVLEIGVSFVGLTRQSLLTVVALTMDKASSFYIVRCYFSLSSDLRTLIMSCMY